VSAPATSWRDALRAIVLRAGDEPDRVVGVLATGDLDPLQLWPLLR
jgi:hypothetical protein